MKKIFVYLFCFIVTGCTTTGGGTVVSSGAKDSGFNKSSVGNPSLSYIDQEKPTLQVVNDLNISNAVNSAAQLH
jgi:predicted small secreted protein